MRTTKDAVGWILSRKTSPTHQDLFNAYILCFGEYPDIRWTDKEVNQHLVDFADGWMYAQDE